MADNIHQAISKDFGVPYKPLSINKPPPDKPQPPNSSKQPPIQPMPTKSHATIAQLPSTTSASTSSTKTIKVPIIGINAGNPSISNPAPAGVPAKGIKRTLDGGDSPAKKKVAFSEDEAIPKKKRMSPTIVGNAVPAPPKTSVLVYSEDEAEVVLGEEEEDEQKPMEHEDKKAKKKTVVVDGQKVTSVHVGAEKLSEAQIKYKFQQYLRMLATEAVIPGRDDYIRDHQRRYAEKDAFLAMCITNFQEGSRFIKSKIVATCERTIREWVTRMPGLLELTEQVITSYKMQTEDLLPLVGGGPVVTFTGQTITDKTPVVKLTLYRDPRKFKPVGESRLGSPSNKAKFPRNDVVLTATIQEAKFASCILEYMTFQDKATLQLLEFRDQHCPEYVKACFDREMYMDLVDVAIQTIDSLKDTNKEANVFLDNLYNEFLRIDGLVNRMGLLARQMVPNQ